MEFTFPARYPFSLDSIINSHGWIQLLPFRKLGNGSSLSYVDRLTTGKIVNLVIEEVSNGVSVAVNQLLTDTEQKEIKDKVNWMLGLDSDFTEFYKLAHSEPRLSSVSKHAKGRVLRSPTLFEDTIKTILTTNTTWNNTKRMVKMLVDELGSPLQESQDQKAFPIPFQIAESGLELLRNKVKLGYRTSYVIDLSKSIVSGTIDLEAYKKSHLPTHELRKLLLTIKGVGNYAAANLLILLGRFDFIPIDTWAMKMVSNEWHNGESISPDEVEAAFERWGKWKGLAFWLWEWRN